MRLPEFLVSLFTRTGLVDMTTLANLKIELSQQLNQFMETSNEKKIKNTELEAQALLLEKEIEGLDPHTPEYEQATFKLDSILDQVEEPSIMEKVVSFFEKPWVRFALLALSVILTRYIMKKLSEPSKPEPEPEEEEIQQGYQYGNQSPPYNNFHQQPFNPYGYGYYPPNPNQRK